MADNLSDRDVVSKYEKRVADEQHAAYIAARSRLAATTSCQQPFGFACAAAEMQSILDFESRYNTKLSLYPPSAFHSIASSLRWWYDNCASVSIVNLL